MRPFPRLLLCIVHFALVPLAFVQEVHGAVAIAPGHETEISHYIRTTLERAGRDAEHADIFIEGDRIRVRLAAAAGESVRREIVVGAPGQRLEVPASTSLAPGVVLDCKTGCSARDINALRPLGEALALERGAVAERLWSTVIHAAEGEAGWMPGWSAWINHLNGWNWLFGAIITLFLYALTQTMAPADNLDRYGLTGAVIVGAILRIAFARHLLMGVSDYGRYIPWLSESLQRGIWILGLTGNTLHRLEIAGKWNLFFSFFLPVVLYTQGKVCFPTGRVPLAAAWLFALCPIAIAFASSNVEFISSILFSSMTLTLLQLMTGARGWRSAIYCAGLVAFFYLTVEARPENIFFSVLVPAAFMLLPGADRKRFRGVEALAFSGIVLVSAYYTHKLLLEGHTGGAGTGVGSIPDFIRAGMPGVKSALLETNNYFYPTRLPVAFTALAALGTLRVLFISFRRFLYLALWFSLIYAAHGLINSNSLLLISRYALHTIVPVIFAGAYGLDLLMKRWLTWHPDRLPLQIARWGLATAALIAAAITTPRSLTLFHIPDDDVQEEYAFLSELWSKNIPEPGSLIVESYDRNGASAAARYSLFASRLRGSRMDTIAESANQLKPHSGNIYLYEGLPCFWHRDPGRELTAACQEGRRAGNWEEVASRKITGPPHDPATGGSAGNWVRLYRLRDGTDLAGQAAVHSELHAGQPRTAKAGNEGTVR